MNWSSSRRPRELERCACDRNDDAVIGASLSDFSAASIRLALPPAMTAVSAANQTAPPPRNDDARPAERRGQRTAVVSDERGFESDEGQQHAVDGELAITMPQVSANTMTACGHEPAHQYE
jgi:hypothetical protein